MPSQPVMSCSLKMKAIMHTPTSVCSFSQEDEHSSDYTYKAGPKKEVILMGTKAFTNFLISIQGCIGTLNIMVGVLEKQVRLLTVRSEGSGPNVEQAACVTYCYFPCLPASSALSHGLLDLPHLFRTPSDPFPVSHMSSTTSQHLPLLPLASTGFRFTSTVFHVVTHIVRFHKR